MLVSKHLSRYEVMPTLLFKRLVLFAFIVLAVVVIIVIDLKAINKNVDSYVTFDTAKYIASRREMTSRLLGNNAEIQQQAVSVLARVEKSTMEILKKHAGNRVVIVKQALVVEGQVPDITDDVLEELGLPTSVVSVQPQIPNRILSNFALSDDYIHGSELNQQVAEEVKRQNAEKLRAFENRKKEQQEKRVQGFLP